MVKIAHLADIHIKDNRRDEYSHIFNKLYLSLKEEKPNIIVVAGDIFDNKSRASANNINDVILFFKNLVNIAPTVVITGNHDTNCTVPGSLDLLTPILNDNKVLSPPNFFYFRNSGTYEELGIYWHVIATDGGKIDPIISEKSLNICLFHEEINGTKLTPDLVAAGYKLNISDFKQFDAALGGHIHIRQIYNNKIAYCGSLIQQNIGESHIKHGYLLWDIDEKTRKVKNITEKDIYNEQGYVRIIINEKGQDITPTPIPNNPIYWDLLYASSSDISHIVDHYTKEFKKEPRSVQAFGNKNEQLPKSKDNKTMIQTQQAGRSLKKHEEIIKKLVDPEYSERVIALHKEKWAPPDYFVAGGKFRLTQLQFSNIYAYGPDNVIDFTKLENDLSGVVANNHTGKSSLIDAILFALYDAHPRTTKKNDVVRKGQKSGQVIAYFELDGKEGVIDKTIYTHTTNSNKSIYNFMYDKKDLTKPTIAETLKEIENVVGSSLDATASSFQIQGGENKGFMGLTAHQRKEFLASVMSLGSFKETLAETKKCISEFNGELKVLEKQFEGTTVEEYQEELKDIEDGLIKYSDYLKAKEEDHIKCTKIREEKLKEISKFSTKRDLIREEIETRENQLNEVGPSTLEDTSPWLKLLGVVEDSELNLPINKIDIDKVKGDVSFDKGKSLLGIVNSIKEEIKKKESDISSHISLLQKLPRPDESKEILETRMKPTDAFNNPLDPPKRKIPEDETSHITNDSQEGDEPTNDELVLMRHAVPLTKEEDDKIKGFSHINIKKVVNTSALNPKTYEEKIQGLSLKISKLDKYIEETNRDIGMYLFDLKTLDSIPALPPKFVPESKSYQEARKKLNSSGVEAGEQVKDLFIFSAACGTCKNNKKKFQQLVSDSKKSAIKADLLYYAKKEHAAKEKILEKYKVDYEKTVEQQKKLIDEYEKTKPYREYLENKELFDKHIKWVEAIDIAKRHNFHLIKLKSEWLEYQNSLRIFKFAQESGDKKHIEDKLKEWKVIEDTEKEIEEMKKGLEKIKERLEASEKTYETFKTNRLEAISGYLYVEEKNKNVSTVQALQTIVSDKKKELEEINNNMKDARKEHLAASAYYTENNKVIVESRDKLGQLKGKKDVIIVKLEAEKKRHKAELIVKDQKQIYEFYRDVLKPDGGIADMLLMSGKEALQNKINEGLKEIGARFKVVIGVDYGIHINLGKEMVPYTMGSGYQQFALSIASRLAIWRYSDKPRPDAIIIDEGFGVCDDDYLSLIADSLESLSQSPHGPKLLFIVSHIEQLKMRLKKALSIEVTENGSKLINLNEVELATPVPVEMAPEVTGIDDIVETDPADDTRVICKACGKSFKLSYINRHMSTQIHRTSMLKFLSEK